MDEKTKTIDRSEDLDITEPRMPAIRAQEQCPQKLVLPDLPTTTDANYFYELRGDFNPEVMPPWFVFLVPVAAIMLFVIICFVTMLVNAAQ